MSAPNAPVIAYISARVNHLTDDLMRVSARLEIGVIGPDALTPEFIADLSRLQSELYRFLAVHPPQTPAPITKDEAVAALRSVL